MSDRNDRRFGRRGLFQTSAALVGGTLLGRNAKADPEPQVRNVNTNSSPSTLKITDVRVATVVRGREEGVATNRPARNVPAGGGNAQGPMPMFGAGCTIIRIDTNQGVYGLGEVRDGASATYALFLKSRLVGENPLRIELPVGEDQAVRRSRPAGGRRGGGRDGAVGHRRQSIWTSRSTRCWAANSATRSASTPTPRNRRIPMVYAQRVKERKEEMGLTWLKMDLGIEMVSDTPGTVTVLPG